MVVPSILFGCDSILFSEAKIAEVECIQARMAKRFLGVSKNTANICAQTEIGFITFVTLPSAAEILFLSSTPS